MIHNIRFVLHNKLFLYERIIMLDKYFDYLFVIMKYSYSIKRRSKKKGMHIYKYDGVKVVALNDYKNRRLLLFFYKESTKQIFRIAFHFFHVRPIRRRIADFVKGIQEDENFFNEKIMSRRSYSYKRERAFKNYMSYINK